MLLNLNVHVCRLGVAQVGLCKVSYFREGYLQGQCLERSVACSSFAGYKITVGLVLLMDRAALELICFRKKCHGYSVGWSHVDCNMIGASIVTNRRWMFL